MKIQKGCGDTATFLYTVFYPFISSAILRATKTPLADA